MTFVGQHINEAQYAGYVAMAVISAMLLVVHCRYVRDMRILAVYILPCVAFFSCFELCVLAQGSDVKNDSVTAYICYVFQSLRIPLMVVVLYELTYRLFEIRTAHFICFPFDQGSDFSKTVGVCSIWLNRLMACGLFAINMVVVYDTADADDYASRGGYMYLSRNSHSLFAWLTLIPPIVLSIVAIVVGGAIARYGNHLTIGLTARIRWKALFVCALVQVVGHIFDTDVYVITSRASELLLLIGITYSVHLVEEDLLLAGAFADYLHRSNMAFDHKYRFEVQEEPPREEVGSLQLTDRSRAV